MPYQYNQFSQGNPYGSLSPLAVAASDRRARALGAAQADAGRATAALTQAGGNPFAAAREAQRGYVAQAGNVNTQASQEMAQIAAQATQQRLAEEERKRQEAEQWIGRGLSAAGSVLGNVLVPGIGGALGGGLGSAIGGMGQPQQSAAPLMPRPTMQLRPGQSAPSQPYAVGLPSQPQPPGTVYDPVRDHAGYQRPMGYGYR